LVNLRHRRSDFDLVHAWGGTALAAAALGTRVPVVYSPGDQPAPREVRWLRAIESARDLQVVASSDTMRRACVTRGLAVERCHLIRPGVEFARINRRRDVSLRATLGFGTDDYILLACGESTRPAAHQLGVWAASILHVLDPRYRLLLWGRGPLAEQAERLSHRTQQPHLTSNAERKLKRAVRFEELLAAADAVLVTATGPVPTLPIAICMAAGLPIVALVTATVSELLEDRHTCLMVGKPAPRLVAQRVLDLRQDTGLQWSIADLARTEAYEYFSMSRFLNQHRTLYRQVAARETVAIPPQSPGAGLRFHGRV